MPIFGPTCENNNSVYRISPPIPNFNDDEDEEAADDRSCSEVENDDVTTDCLQDNSEELEFSSQLLARCVVGPAGDSQSVIATDLSPSGLNGMHESGADQEDIGENDVKSINPELEEGKKRKFCCIDEGGSFSEDDIELEEEDTKGPPAKWLGITIKGIIPLKIQVEKLFANRDKNRPRKRHNTLTSEDEEPPGKKNMNSHDVMPEASLPIMDSSCLDCSSPVLNGSPVIHEEDDLCGPLILKSSGLEIDLGLLDVTPILQASEASDESLPTQDL